MSRLPFPRTLSAFQSRFATEEACVHYLFESRWADGYACPRCGHDEAYELELRPKYANATAPSPTRAMTTGARRKDMRRTLSSSSPACTGCSRTSKRGWRERTTGWASSTCNIISTSMCFVSTGDALRWQPFSRSSDSPASTNRPPTTCCMMVSQPDKQNEGYSSFVIRALATKTGAQFGDEFFVDEIVAVSDDAGELVVTDADEVHQLVLEEESLSQHDSPQRLEIETWHQAVGISRTHRPVLKRSRCSSSATRRGT